MFKDRTLLITGGTGSFGNAIVTRFWIRTLARSGYSVVTRKSRGHALALKSDKVKFYIGDVREYESVHEALRGVDYVFHAAALKQVPSCEFYPMEAVRTNIQGADNVVRAAIANRVRRCVFLSTDKAVYPINAMGMSKAMMEKIVVAKSRLAGSAGTVLAATRYGNVMASRGSVIPLFIEQLKQGKPLTLTDPNMTRFLMSLDDSVDLVLYAFEHASPGDIFVQKSPASTVETLPRRCANLLSADSEIRVIGTRHARNSTSPWCPARNGPLGRRRQLLQNPRGFPRPSTTTSTLSAACRKFPLPRTYTSHNTQRLNVHEVKELLLKLAMVREAVRA